MLVKVVRLQDIENRAVFPLNPENGTFSQYLNHRHAPISILLDYKKVLTIWYLFSTPGLSYEFVICKLHISVTITVI